MAIHEAYHDTMNVILWKRPGTKFVVDGPGMDGVLREGSWDGPGAEPTTTEIAGWKEEFIDGNISHELGAESRITDEALAGMYAVFEATTGSPPTDAEKESLKNSMKANLPDD
jgi:hypothetical protein